MGQAECYAALIEWFEEMKEHGIKVTIVSNNNEKRVKIFSQNRLNIPFIYKAKKPMGKAFRRAVKNMELKKEDSLSSETSSDRCAWGEPKRLPYDFGRASGFL